MYETHKYDNVKDYIIDIRLDAKGGNMHAALLTTTLLAAFLADMICYEEDSK